MIAFSTMCQVLVLSVFNGFEGLVQSLYSNFYSDVKVVPSKGKTIVLTPEQLNQIHKLAGVKGISTDVEEKALLQNGEQQTVVLLKGVDSNYYKVSGVPQKMFHGTFNIGTIGDPNEFSALEISLTNPEQSEKFTESLQKTLGDQYKVLTKFQQNTSLYNSMRLEKWFIYAVLTLILIIAAFNMVGALTMLVLEKRKDISVLQALGADKSLVKKIFLSEGILLAVTGAGTGIILALIIAFLQLKFHLIKLIGNSFLIDYFPVKLVITDFILVIFTSLIIAFFASWFPAKKAANQMFNLKA